MTRQKLCLGIAAAKYMCPLFAIDHQVKLPKDSMSTHFPVFDHQVLYCMEYFEFSSLFWGSKEKNEIKAVTEGKSGSDYNCAMFKIFNSTA